MQIYTVFVQMKLSVIRPDNSEALEDLITRIARFSNTQNMVKDSDFFSNHEFHRLFEGSAQSEIAPPIAGETTDSTYWFYERARGQYAEARSQSSTPSERKNIKQGGLLKYVHGEEFHAYNPDVVKTLQDAVKSGDYEDYKKYSNIVHSREKMVIRDMLDFNSPKDPIPLEEVEPIENILLRFDSAGMSLGAVSPDDHETLAHAMNKKGGRAN